MTQRERVLIAPSILSADFSRLAEEVRAVEEGGADILHIDVMDGHFVPNLTVGPLVVRALRPVTALPIHVHLMIEKPERYIDVFAEAGADLITVHVETCPHLHRTLEQIREAGARPAVVLNPATPLITLQEVLDQVDLVLVMTVDPGFGGQTLIPGMLGKVRRLREMLPDDVAAPRIEVDGGVNKETLADVVRAGADVLVMGSAIFEEAGGPAEAVRDYRRRIEALLTSPAPCDPTQKRRWSRRD
ncbi:MAG: ribulose-phosphate 3-epimerase [Chloroflexi bacterium]|nr:ribulose-phosphate 3-epimerase [Chloroflexota bacterium]